MDRLTLKDNHKQEYDEFCAKEQEGEVGDCNDFPFECENSKEEN